MAKVTDLALTIDWGFTRFKSWIHTCNRELVFYSSINNSELCEDSIFYSHHDLLRIQSHIVDLLRSIDNPVRLKVFTSSQMHCLAGSSIELGLFLSTWNDIPAVANDEGDIYPIAGIPNLPSMPVYKTDLDLPRLTLATSRVSLDFHSPITIGYVSSPVSLLFSQILNERLPCSYSWWQSTCLPNPVTLNNSGSGSYVSETPVRFGSDQLASVNSNICSLEYYPEVGDLQASTYLSLNKHDIVINVGTGSQVILSCKPQLLNFPYFRLWPKYLQSLPVISHIPCGRLLQEYTNHNHMSFDHLGSLMLDLTAEAIEESIHKHDQSILFFPGFCAYCKKYIASPVVSAGDIGEIAPSAFLSLWIYQYKRVLELLLGIRLASCGNFSIAVTGELGGLSVGLVRCLNLLLPDNLIVTLENSELPDSLFAMHSS